MAFEYLSLESSCARILVTSIRFRCVTWWSPCIVCESFIKLPDMAFEYLLLESSVQESWLLVYKIQTCNMMVFMYCLWIIYQTAWHGIWVLVTWELLCKNLGYYYIRFRRVTWWSSCIVCESFIKLPDMAFEYLLLESSCARILVTSI